MLSFDHPSSCTFMSISPPPIQRRPGCNRTIRPAMKMGSGVARPMGVTALRSYPVCGAQRYQGPNTPFVKGAFINRGGPSVNAYSRCRIGLALPLSAEYTRRPSGAQAQD